MMMSKVLATAALLIGTAGCATSLPGRLLSSGPAPEPPPVHQPPAECQEPAPDRPTFLIPVLPPAPVEATDPLAGSRQPGTLAETFRSREHWRARGEQAEALASAALDYISRDRTADETVDDLVNRCAGDDRAEAESLEAWAARVRTRNEDR